MALRGLDGDPASGSAFALRSSGPVGAQLRAPGEKHVARFRAAIDGDPAAAEVPAYAAQSALRAVVRGKDKLVYDLERDEARLFDLGIDPGEQHDLARERPAELRALEEHLLERVAATEGGGDTKRAAKTSREVQERLRALGYLE